MFASLSFYVHAACAHMRTRQKSRNLVLYRNTDTPRPAICETNKREYTGAEHTGKEARDEDMQSIQHGSNYSQKSKNVIRLMKDIGCSDVEANAGYTKKPGEESNIGVCIGNKRVSVNGQDYRLFVKGHERQKGQGR